MRTIVVCVAVGLAGASLAVGEPKKKTVRTYTNEDLERVAPLRAETGALSQPAAPPPPERARSGSPSRPVGAPDETYWRREAERLQERLRQLRQKANDLRRRLVAARSAETRPRQGRSRSGSRAAAGTSIHDLEQRLAAVEDEMRERQSALEERARRAGALPGWIR